ncbi:hypothetical protein JCM9279_002745 [Rhodotorula babjevae]
MRNTPGPGRNHPPRSFNTSSLSRAVSLLSDPPRNRTEPSIPPPAPSHDYLDVASATSEKVSSTGAAKIDPLVVVLSLNETVGCRRRAGRGAGEREIQVVVYSAARAYNVLALLRAIGLVVPAASIDDDGAYRPRADHGDVLKLVFTRETMNLRDEDYRADVVTDTDLNGAVQPHSRVPIVPFTVADPSIAIRRRNMQVQELSSSAPDDAALFSTVYFLERLRGESNVAAALRSGLVRSATDDARRAVREREELGDRDAVTDKQVQGELARLGREVCAKYGVEVRREWDDGWKVKARV